MPLIKDIEELVKGFRDYEGIEVSRGFFLITKILTYLCIIATLVFQVVTSPYTVAADERAVVTQFGHVVSIEEPGLQFRIPFIQDVYKVSMRTNGIDIGYDMATNEFIEDESFVITKDFNFLNVDFYVEWRVSDPVAYLFNSDEPELILRRVVQAVARATVAEYPVDEVLTVARNEIQMKVKDTVTEELELYNLGMTISNITIQDVLYPTTSVETAFKAVENARQGKETAMNDANKYKNELIPEARAGADQIIQRGEAIKQSRINESNGQVARFNELYREYSRNPEITRTRIYLETMEQVLPDVDVVIIGQEEVLQFLPIGGFGSGE